MADDRSRIACSRPRPRPTMRLLLLLPVVLAKGSTDGGHRRVPSGSNHPLFGGDGGGDRNGIVVTFPIAEGQQPGDFPPRRYEELLAGTGLVAAKATQSSSPDAPSAISSGDARAERAKALEDRETVSRKNLRALMMEWAVLFN
mmetsp:Transcript_33651/g.83833  ORF Transcript_33651/g.83833 Transcript_33651/m.83833 type:complete len:144 (+) Transcript_33651:3-434(+)